MKTVTYIFLTSICIVCSGHITTGNENINNNEVGAIDTISILQLQGKIYTNQDYKIVRLSNLDSNGYQIHSTRRIEISQKNKTIASIPLPIPNEEIKNFSVNSIEETDKGFKIVVAWGGGNYFYGREFYFSIKDSQFYLVRLLMSRYTQTPYKITKKTQKINPPISIDKFNILYFLKNE